MATAVPEDFRGATITFSGGFIAKIIDASWDGIERQMLSTSTSDTTTAHTWKVVDLYEAGSLSVTMQHDATTAAPISGAQESVTVNFPGAPSSTMQATGAMSGYSVTGSTGETDSITTATATIKFSGAITWG